MLKAGVGFAFRIAFAMNRRLQYRPVSLDGGRTNGAKCCPCLRSLAWLRRS